MNESTHAAFIALLAEAVAVTLFIAVIALWAGVLTGKI